ncbi:cell division protein FtsK [Saccharopolyspora rhizosphaerae]|uniref:Cell division protein FtsK n=1 Tax=Saccharopolyspora rhizosphaerae TaxID=2492662 RepID=A0A3R8P2V8_9PSEU|nr:FtsK/SpoIIIE domain-containing protein [Saccharopolyspora rhizosphaerae]RRO15389.1 cell division protein FtsK [Saccharopolyspora rhizosphaerae]
MKRSDRRRRIESAFEHLRSSISAALGAAENAHQRVLDTCAEQEHALRIAQFGTARAEREPEQVTDDPADRHFQVALRRALAERDETFREWTEQGPPALQELVLGSSPGSASGEFGDWLGTIGDGDTAHPPELWRIGTATVPDAPRSSAFPAVVPALDFAHLRITTDEVPDTAEPLVQNLLLRLLSHFPPGQVRIHSWDVARLTGTLPDLHPLTSADLLTAHDPTQLGEMLDVLSDHVKRIHRHALLGEHTTVRELAAAQGKRSEPWRIAVLFGNGQPLREEQQQQLQRIARNGLACGIQLITVDLPMTVNSTFESITLIGENRARTSMTGPEAVVALDDPPSRGEAAKTCSKIAAEFESRRARVRTFDDLLPDELWQCHSRSELQAPVGFDEGEEVWVRLGDASPHTLIGGPSGSGKTNFLYGMLGAMAARYSPDELELYLLDFKEGVSFAQFTPGRRDPSWLPHAKLVGVNVNTDREFGLALLRFLADEMRRRADKAKEYEVTKLEELRAEDPEGRWPRIVAVIDEFQYLFADRDPVTAQATKLLEDVARRGRSQGIHLVLASQDVSGIEAFWGKPAIFEQFILRIALPKARRVLTEHNHAAMELPRWHAVVNHESGVKHGNEIARIPDATARDTFHQLQHQLWERRAAGSQPPRLFDGSNLPKLSSMADYRTLTTSAGTPRALLGQVIDVEGTAAAVRLSRSPGRNIAVIGSVREDTTSALGAAALSLSRQHEPGKIRFTIGALLDDVDAEARAVAEDLRGRGHEVDVVGLDEVSATLDGIAAGIAAGAAEVRHCVVLYAVDAAQTTLERKDPVTRACALDSLRTILKQGPESRVHVIGWWRSVQRVKNTLGMGPVDDIGAWVAFDVHGQELSTFAAGQPVNWSPRSRRGLFFDRSVHSRPEVVLPFDLGGAPPVPAQRTTELAAELWEEAGD